ncbi:hypothetical protein JOC77_001354 [Peribacillus deserti]|uniref:Uncharacterized protein n=1 Tax=Peribacillus deserti TaxID=673318 RepID=A0ABS2QFM1_9BACI|nr:hypothetical protein [Peribacillus deserti]MBM7691944.1 hypothetical protein [Peribacillus deserti]
MENLEYRLNDNFQGYPALFQYQNLDTAELACRMSCEYYIKNAEVYRVVSSAVEPHANCVLYVEKEGSNHPYPDEKMYRGITIEIREFISKDNSPLLDVLELNYHTEALKYLQSDFIYTREIGKKGTFNEMELVCTEIDEDRGNYVFYGKRTGVQVNR